MTHREVKTRQQEVSILIDYLVKLKIKNGTLFYGLNRNVDFLAKANEEIDKMTKQTLPELFELESKAVEIIKGLNDKIEKDNAKLAEKEKDSEVKTKPQELLTVIDGLAKLTKEEQDKHDALMLEYNKLLDKEDDVRTYMLKKDVLDKLEIDFWAVRLLSHFIEKED